ncbi:DUF7691 family protein [Thermomonospora umbrina]|uniref:DUF7691 domain-containing protein n=1 Tax=Thermomonospora umbrina TaxID=111806 RepID=A0A3D9SX80_9ACTN|nr:hypothetical protein [Thermomonospora umbrina]REE96211.1 hypothetical protein DFJ69_1638 [Thermomonospora umbrina]
MGYGIMPYAVDVNVLRSPHKYAADPDDFLAWIQDRHCTDDEWEAGPTRQALRELFYGEPHTGTEGHTYGYALKALCSTFGSLRDNGSWYPFGSGWPETVRNALADVGVKFDPEDLMYSGPPVPLPSIDDFPVIGHVLRDELRPTFEALNAADLSPIGDRQVVEAITELHGWMRHCVENDYDLVCFYH